MTAEFGPQFTGVPHVAFGCTGRARPGPAPRYLMCTCSGSGVAGRRVTAACNGMEDT